MEVLGRVHSAETFGTLDGPGIRYVLFLQGCPLRCKYCHNRDTWATRLGEELTVREVIEDVLKYYSFYKKSGGGLTISGGEPTLQREFVTEVFKKVKDMGLNTALDTSGFIEAEKMESLLDVTDLVILDLKAIDAKEHQALTGVDNKKILDFARYLRTLSKPTWIKYVLIPGINDSEKQLTDLADFIKDFKNVEKLELLPYHKLGVHKWEICGEEDPLKDVPAATEEDLKKARSILRKNKLSFVI